MKALIIGAGIAGPVAALALRKAGIDSTIYEAYATTAEGIGGVLMVAPNGLNALRIIGANEAVRAIGQPIPRMVIANGRGKRFGEFTGLPDVPPSLVMWRSELYRVLHDHALAHGIRIEYGKRLVGAVDTPTGITARFTDGSTARGRAHRRRRDPIYGPDADRSGRTRSAIHWSSWVRWLRGRQRGAGAARRHALRLR